MVDVKDEEPPCTTTTDAVVHAARRVCGSAPVDEALVAVGLQEAGRSLAGLGLRTTRPTCGCSAAGPYKPHEAPEAARHGGNRREKTGRENR